MNDSTGEHSETSAQRELIAENECLKIDVPPVLLNNQISPTNISFLAGNRKVSTFFVNKRKNKAAVPFETPALLFSMIEQYTSKTDHTT